MKELLAIILLTLSTLAYSQRGSMSGDRGNGGYSIVCRDREKKITEATLLDIYEGRELYNLVYSNGNDTADEFIEAALSKVAHHKDYSLKIRGEIQKVRSNIHFLRTGIDLEETDDALPIIRKRGCKFEQLANYLNNGLLFVSREIFDALSNLDRAAFFIHEAAYAIRRTPPYEDQNSRNSRRLTAHLLASNGDQAFIDQFISEDGPLTLKTCGLNGSVSERIADCSPYDARGTLVTRTIDSLELHIDRRTNRLWSDPLRPVFTHFQAKEACGKPNLRELGGINGKWRLPTKVEYKNKNVKDVSGSFWSVNVNFRDPSTAWESTGRSGHYSDRWEKRSVRCVLSLAESFL